MSIKKEMYRIPSDGVNLDVRILSTLHRLRIKLPELSGRTEGRKSVTRVMVETESYKIDPVIMVLDNK